MKKLLAVALLSLAAVAATTGTASAWICNHPLLNHFCCHHGCCTTICCKPYNAFSPNCFGTLCCDGCAPMANFTNPAPWGYGSPAQPTCGTSFCGDGCDGVTHLPNPGSLLTLPPSQAPAAAAPSTFQPPTPALMPGGPGLSSQLYPFQSPWGIQTAGYNPGMMPGYNPGMMPAANYNPAMLNNVAPNAFSGGR